MNIWINGELLNAAAPTLPAISAGATLGWGVYTTAAVWHGQVFALSRHLQRLRHDAARADIPLAYDDETLHRAVTAVLTDNQVQHGLLRITLLRRGDGRWNDAQGSDLFMISRPHSPDYDDPSTQRLRLVLSPFRIEARRALSGVKSTSYGDYQLAWQQATRAGFDETVLCNGSGALCECARANLFWVRDGRLFTPSLDSGCLPGIARELALRWAGEDGITCKEGLFSMHELAAADEVFLTAATQGPRAVQSFALGAEDESPYPFCAPGEITAMLQKRWQQAVHART
ncbi:MAG TPA: aminotransferase class IV [Abditibacteriaceae bacterium]|jgi:branched-chain amino acid aminotransferase